MINFHSNLNSFVMDPISTSTSTSTSYTGNLTRDNIAHHIQGLIKTTYQLPCQEDPNEVTFMHKGRVESWGHLSKEEKGEILLECALPHHNKDEIKADPDKALMAPKFRQQRKDFEALVPQDPRKAHGTDHGVRAAIYAPVFAYIYNLFHPTANITPLEVLAAQFSAFGHDCMRQSEGIDIYDEGSAKRVRDELGQLNVCPELIQGADEGIGRKDSEPTEKKSFIAKCVQCSDSAEFSRFCSAAKPWNPEKTDIFVELKKMEKLKNGATFEDFKTYLEKVTKEMNQFTAETHTLSVRQEASQSSNYYLNFLDRIKNSSNYPILKQILIDQKVIL